MGWQERDYARGPGPSYRGSLGGHGGRGIWGGSIVKKLLIANIVIYVLCWILITPLATFLRGSPQPTVHRVMTPRGPGLVVEHHPGFGEMVTSKVLHGQVWRLVTSQYLHAQRMEHVLFNMIGLYFLGQALERVWGNKKFFVIYTLSGVCGNLLLMAGGIIGWIDPTTPAVGASGCILGLLGAAAVMFPQAEIYVYFLFPIKIRTAAILFALMYAFNIWRQGANYGGDLCHMAGLVFGAWWAWKGERWWATRRHTFAPRTPPGTGRGIWPGIGTGAWRQKVERRVADEEVVDRILAKVREGGIGTLTASEKKTLLEATEALRRQEDEAGRVDRL